MTQGEFNGMPALLGPEHMFTITGLAKGGLKTLREGNPQIVARRCGKKGKFLYVKSEVAKVCGLRYE